ncbi:MAG: trypsin-like peptidase domain-containing protein [Planctomycetota bacterium]
MGRVVAMSVLAALSAAAWAGNGEGPPKVFPRRNAIVVAVEKAGPGVVNISTERIVRRPSHPFFKFRDPFFERHFRDYFERFARPRQEVRNSLGSGVVVDSDGYVVTNEHVVRRASKIHVTLSDGRKLEGELLSRDPDSDLALIKVDSEKPLPTVPMGRSDDLMIGETVIALGNPFGLESTVTVGVLSAKDRSVMLGGQEAYAGLIQSDAAINPGNSGGALCNIHGELIGINVAIHAQAEGIGFAIPIDTVRKVLCALFNYRLINKTYIGIQVQECSLEAARRFGHDSRELALVTAVEDDSPAARAGLKPGDGIVAVDGQAVANSLAFMKAMLAKDAGDETELTVVRRGKRLTRRVTVAEVPKPSGEELARQRLGLGLQRMTQELARSFGLRRPTGLLITEVVEGGPGDAAGLRAGDVIVRFGSLSIDTLDQLAIVLEQVERGAKIGLVVVRRRRLYRARIRTR